MCTKDTAGAITAALLLTGLCAGTAHALAGAVLGQKALVKNPSTPDKRKVQVQGKEKASDDPSPTTGDPATNGAAMTIVVAGATSSSQMFLLPGGSLWKLLSTGWKYSDSHGLNGPVKQLGLKKSTGGTFVAKLLLLGKNGTVDTLPANPTTDVSMNVTLLGGGPSYCIIVGAASGATASKNTATVYQAKNATAQVDCSTAATTTTSTSTSTTCPPDPTKPGQGNERWHRGRRRPLEGGWSVGSIIDRQGAGTLGAIVVDGTGTKYILSNNHVLARQSDRNRATRDGVFNVETNIQPLIAPPKYPERILQPAGGERRCFGGANDGGVCATNNDCNNGTCEGPGMCAGGTSNLQPCAAPADCPGGGSCVPTGFCSAGGLASPCYDAADCQGSVCLGLAATLPAIVGAAGAPRLDPYEPLCMLNGQPSPCPGMGTCAGPGDNGQGCRVNADCPSMAMNACQFGFCVGLGDAREPCNADADCPSMALNACLKPPVPVNLCNYDACVDNDDNNCIDAAIARTDSAASAFVLDVIAAGAPGTPRGPATCKDADKDTSLIGLLVQKSGRTTGRTWGRIRDIKSHMLQYFQKTTTTGDGSAEFVNQLQIEPVGGIKFCCDAGNPRRNGTECTGDADCDNVPGACRYTFCCGGDSGSVVFTTDNPPRPVGLLFAGDTTEDQNAHAWTCYANPIKAVLDRFGVGFATTTSTSTTTSTTVP